MSTHEEPVTYAPEQPARLRWAQHAPEVYKAMIQLDAVANQGLDPRLRELVKIRASQINHCARCLDMHSKDALAAGESVERIVQLGAWEESRHFYTEKELAALELTDAITVLTGGTSQTKSGEDSCRTRFTSGPPSTSARPSSPG